MDVKAIILVGGEADASHRLGGVPIAFLDVLGEPVLQRVLNRLEHFGVTATAVVSDVALSEAPIARGSIRPGLRWAEASGPQFWRAVEGFFNDFAQSGSRSCSCCGLGHMPNSNTRKSFSSIWTKSAASPVFPHRTESLLVVSWSVPLAVTTQPT